MRIARDLNLVLPVDTDSGTVYVHSTPISYEVFEKYFLVLTKTFSAIYQEGLNTIGGPKAAALLLKRIAMQTMGDERGTNAWEGPDGVENGLMNEIRRLTNVVMPVGSLSAVPDSDPLVMAPGGWETISFYDVINKKLLSRQDIAEVEGVVCFFIVSSACHQRKILPSFLDAMASLLDARIVSLSVSEYAHSLPTSIADESSGVRAA